MLKDVNSDQQQSGLEADVDIDRPTSMRLGLTLSAIDNTLYDAFGQRQVSTIYNALNQYHVMMEAAPRYWQSPESLKGVYVSTSGANPIGLRQSPTSTRAMFACGQRPAASGRHGRRRFRRAISRSTRSPRAAIRRPPPARRCRRRRRR